MAEVKGIVQQNVQQVAQPAKKPSVVPGVSSHPDDLMHDQVLGPGDAQPPTE